VAKQVAVSDDSLKSTDVELAAPPTVP
jgi:hypothetical protein